MKHVHLIGIGGTGLSAIARVLLESGYTVSGSDQQSSPLAESLASAGARVYLGHQAYHVNGADIVIRSSAVPDDNVEIQAARSKGIEVLKRADFLEDLMAGKVGIAIAGTHGKTSTTAMITWMLVELGFDPSFILGGVISGLGVNARAGSGQAFIIEADEYDRMFLGLRPGIAVVTNVEHDHPDCYPTERDFFEAFQAFVSRMTPNGVLIICGDDPGARQLLPDAHRHGVHAVTYGYRDPANEYTAKQLKLSPEYLTYEFQLHLHDQELASVSLKVPGVHSVLNACAALVVADQMNLPLSEAAEALSGFQGVERRFEVVGERKGITVISDYAHHPTEIRATLAAARSRYPDREIWAVWQPHTYSRARLLFESFVHAFEDADHVLVSEVYPAREPVDLGFSASQLVKAMAHSHAQFVPDLIDAVHFLEEKLKPGDVLIVLSAGNADQICYRVLNALV